MLTPLASHTHSSPLTLDLMPLVSHPRSTPPTLTIHLSTPTQPPHPHTLTPHPRTSIHHYCTAAMAPQLQLPRPLRSASQRGHTPSRIAQSRPPGPVLKDVPSGGTDLQQRKAGDEDRGAEQVGVTSVGGAPARQELLVVGGKMEVASDPQRYT